MYSTSIRPHSLILAKSTSVQKLYPNSPCHFPQRFSSRGFRSSRHSQLQCTERLLKSSRKSKRLRKESTQQHFRADVFTKTLNEERKRVKELHERHRQEKLNDAVDNIDFGDLPLPEEIKRDIRKTIEENPDQDKIEFEITFFSFRFIRRVLAVMLVAGILLFYTIFLVFERFRNKEEFWEVINFSFEKKKK